MNYQPLFSVLIANYNNGKYLMDAIESVRKQTYTNWEIILVDDVSIDDSRKLYKELEHDKRIHIYYNEQNQGCGFTKHRCAELANGELCGFLDPDDALTENALEVMALYHLSNENVSLLSSRFFYCDEELVVYDESSEKESLPIGMSFLEYQSAAVTHFVTYKNALYKKTNGINPFLLRAVDHDLYYLLEEVGDILFVNECLYFYRTNTGLNISLGDNYVKSVLWDFISMVDACKRRKVSPEKYIFSSFINYIDDEKKKVEDRIRNTLTYRIGRLILFPIKIISKIITKNV